MVSSWDGGLVRLPKRGWNSSPFPRSMAVKIIEYTFDSVPYMISRKTIHIEWGDCDPAQIVYFPRYFEYFDSCTAALFAKAGFPKRKMLQTYGILGFPVVEVKGSFKAPSR